MNSLRIIKGLLTLYRDLLLLCRRESDFYRIKPKTSILILTYRCNSRCKTCTMWQRDHKEEIKKEIDLSGWKTIIDKLADAGVRSTEIFGGNVLLRKDVLIPVLEYLYGKGMAVHLPTNQIGLDDDVARAIVRYVDSVYVSTDGLVDQQDRIRGIEGASSLAEDAIGKLNRYRSELRNHGKSLRMVCNCTVSRFNIDQMHAIVEHAIHKGFDEVHFEYAGEFEKSDIEKSKVMGIVPEPYFVRQDATILADRNGAGQIKENVKDIKKRFKHSNIQISTINIDLLSKENLVQGTSIHKKCYSERNEVTVDPYGNVVICPFINNYAIENLLVLPFNDVWNNIKHRNFRRVQNSNSLPMCRRCILGVQRNPGVLKSLEKIYLTRIQPYLL